MEDAEKLCELLFLWLEKRKELADKLLAVAQKLEDLHKSSNISRVVGTATSVLSIFGAALASVCTGGLAVPLLAAAAAGSVVGVTSTLVEVGFSRSAMNTATALIIEDQKIGRNIQEVLQSLRERCGGMQLGAQASGGSTSDTVECEVATLLMGALARRNKIVVPLDMLRSFNRATFFRQEVGLNSADAHRLISQAVGLVVNIGKSGAMEVSKVSVKEMVKDMGSIGMSTGVTTGSRLLSGIGLSGSLYDLIVRCEEMVKGNQVTEANRFLRDSARKILEAGKKLNDQLNAMVEIIQKLLRVKKLLKDLGGYSHTMTEADQKIMNYIIATCPDSTVVSWLHQPSRQIEFLNLIRFFSEKLIRLLEDLRKPQGNHVDIVFVAHGEITDQFMPARCLVPPPIITETILYSPWNCKIDSNAAYSIAQGNIELRNRVFRNNIRVQFEPNPLPYRWNCMQESLFNIPMILLSPVGPEDRAWKEFQALQEGQMEIEGRIIIPYILPQASLSAYGKIPLYVFIFASWFTLMTSGTTATVHLAACLDRAGSTPRPEEWRAQYAYTNDGTVMTVNVDMVNVNPLLFRALRSMFDRNIR